MSIYDEVSRRIEELRRDDWEWVKAEPQGCGQMCAVVDGSNAIDQNRIALDNGTIDKIDTWIRANMCHDNGEVKWTGLVEYNDDDDGAQSVDDVIIVLEKFRAEL